MLRKGNQRSLKSVHWEVLTRRPGSLLRSWAWFWWGEWTWTGQIRRLRWRRGLGTRTPHFPLNLWSKKKNQNQHFRQNYSAFSVKSLIWERNKINNSVKITPRFLSNLLSGRNKINRTIICKARTESNSSGKCNRNNKNSLRYVKIISVSKTVVLFSGLLNIKLLFDVGLWCDGPFESWGGDKKLPFKKLLHSVDLRKKLILGTHWAPVSKCRRIDLPRKVMKARILSFFAQFCSPRTLWCVVALCQLPWPLLL